VTLSLVPQLLYNLRSKLEAVVADPQAASVRSTATTMLEQFNQRFGAGEVESMPVKMMIAAALDPRTKAMPFLTAADRILVDAEVEIAAVAIYKTMCSTTSAAAAAAAAATPTAAATDTATAAAENDNDDDDLFNCDAKTQAAATTSKSSLPHQTLQEQAVMAVRHEMSVLSRMEALKHTLLLAGNPLEWFFNNRLMMPTLWELFKRVAPIPATSASSERVFSSAGATATKTRNRLMEDNLSRLVFLRGSWQRVADLVLAQAATHSNSNGCSSVRQPQSVNSNGSSSSSARQSQSFSSSSSARQPQSVNSSSSSSKASGTKHQVVDLSGTVKHTTAAKQSSIQSFTVEGVATYGWTTGAAGVGAGVPRNAVSDKASSSKQSSSGVANSGKKRKRNRSAAAAAIAASSAASSAASNAASSAIRKKHADKKATRSGSKTSTEVKGEKKLVSGSSRGNPPNSGTLKAPCTGLSITCASKQFCGQWWGVQSSENSNEHIVLW
jgi:trimeric autotransporter adhesin